VPLQNRVTPTGEIVTDPGRGLFTGNRGCLHDAGRRLAVSRWRSKLWICCVLDWKGRVRDPMPPGRWTMLFFLDEATALAAGHRPCAYCRRADFLSYADAWGRAYDLRDPGTGGPTRGRAPGIDEQLHRERVESRTRRQVARPALAGELPDGAMIRRGGVPGLILSGRFLVWSFQGYGQPEPLGPKTPVELLTPPSSVAVMRAGYRPALHPTALAGWRHGD
jgi:hypothetical protein